MNLGIKFRQNFIVADEHEIAEWRGVADDDHQPRAAPGGEAALQVVLGVMLVSLNALEKRPGLPA
jgi:hypothetical protein